MKGFSYDYLGPENLTRNLEVKDGVLAPSGPSYRALILSNETAISGATIDAIEVYASAGLPLFLVGALPSACLGLNACPNGEPAVLFESMASRHENGKAVATATDLPVALQKAGVFPRVSFATAPDTWYSVWRKAGDDLEDYVYMHNQGQTATVQTLFNVSSSTPFILDAWTGERLPVLQYEQS